MEVGLCLNEAGECNINDIQSNVKGGENAKEDAWRIHG